MSQPLPPSFESNAYPTHSHANLHGGFRACFVVVALLITCSALSAQGAAVGTIEGRVYNPGTGEYLELARITVEGTSLETLTDASGQYRLGNVPAGVAKVRAFRTGVVARTQPVTVTAGERRSSISI